MRNPQFFAKSCKLLFEIERCVILRTFLVSYHICVEVYRTSLPKLLIKTDDYFKEVMQLKATSP